MAAQLILRSADSIDSVSARLPNRRNCLDYKHDARIGPRLTFSVSRPLVMAHVETT